LLRCTWVEMGPSRHFAAMLHFDLFRSDADFEPDPKRTSAFIRTRVQTLAAGIGRASVRATADLLHKL
jgi:hypothetical protein